MGIHLSLEWSWMVFNLLLKGISDLEIKFQSNLKEILANKRKDKHFLLMKKYTIIIISYGPIFLFKTNSIF